MMEDAKVLAMDEPTSSLTPAEFERVAASPHERRVAELYALYERELAAMEKTDEPTALDKILAVLREHAPQYYDTAEEA